MNERDHKPHESAYRVDHQSHIFLFKLQWRMRRVSDRYLQVADDADGGANTTTVVNAIFIYFQHQRFAAAARW